MAISLSIVTLNLNELNYPIKRHRVIEQIIFFKRNNQTNLYANGTQIKAGVAMSDKINAKTKTVIRDKEESYIIKESIQHQDVTCIIFMNQTQEHQNVKSKQ